MKKITEVYVVAFQRLLPGPFTIALLLSFFVFLASVVYLYHYQHSWVEAIYKTARFWENGLWTSSMLEFSFQMMMMLVLGHALAISPFFDQHIRKLLKLCKNNAVAAALVAFVTCLAALFNWAFGLIIGSVFARKVAEYAATHSIPINYPLIGAAGYSGLMIWHAGISGSSLTKASEPGHLRSLVAGVAEVREVHQIPESLSFLETVFSWQNLYVVGLSLVLIPLFFYLLGKGGVKKVPPSLSSYERVSFSVYLPVGMEKLDYNTYFGRFVGLMILGYLVLHYFILSESFSWSFTPNMINLFLLGLVLFFHSSVMSMQKAVEEAITGTSGILLQFPLYFGIMGIMKESGLVAYISERIIASSDEASLPIVNFINSALINIFVPSGGGQWAIQGPVVVISAMESGSSIAKNILAFAYGDQLTNMLQPFWALPLLGITRLSAREILPYSTLLMMLGAVIFASGLLLF